jgi:DNA-directed RNA polymerase beta' subunit
MADTFKGQPFEKISYQLKFNLLQNAVQEYVQNGIERSSSHHGRNLKT